MSQSEFFMHRCVDLAVLGSGYVAPNPLVGAVLVHEGKIIGEGYHQRFGAAHAEVNCLSSVLPPDKNLISKSTLYISLEPCAHHGKTPPCTDLILQNKISSVVIGCRDPFNKVNGRGVDKLRDAGVVVTENVLYDECRNLNKRFFTFHEKNRPYIFLKWAQSADNKISGPAGTQIKITNKYSDILVHKMRSEEAAILVGKRTVLADDPRLTTRQWPGKNPLRIILANARDLPGDLKILNDGLPVILFEKEKLSKEGAKFLQLAEIVQKLHQMNLLSVIIEGGSETLRRFIEAEIWDEAIVFTNTIIQQQEGIDAPLLRGNFASRTVRFHQDAVEYHLNHP